MLHLVKYISNAATRTVRTGALKCHLRALFVSRTQQCFAVKSGIVAILTLHVREVFCSTSEGILPLVD
jgi:hypothetical protein